MRRFTAALAPVFSLVLAAGCENPADNVPKADVSAAQPETPTKPAESTPAVGDSPAPALTLPAGALAFSGDSSKVEFTGSKVTGSHSGGFKSFTGGIALVPDKPEVESVTVEIDMSSTFSDNEKLTGHLKSKDFFHVDAHPKASFTSTKIEAGGKDGATHTVTGNLTLHGQTKSISFPATITVKDGAASIKSEFAINRKDFGISFAGMTNDLIRDEVVIRIDVSAPAK